MLISTNILLNKLSSLALSATPQALAELPTLAPGLYVLRTTTATGTTTQKHQAGLLSSGPAWCFWEASRGATIIKLLDFAN
jgi:hypothetical protein